jgi:hypothetical protein
MRPQQTIAREPDQRASYRQLAYNVVSCGRVNLLNRSVLFFFEPELP